MNDDDDLFDEPAPVPAMPLTMAASWAPADMVAWMRREDGKLPAAMWARYMLLLTDDRMRLVWDWHLSVRKNATRELDQSSFELDQSSLSLAVSIDIARAFPSKPGDMTKKNREEYFRKMRRHAEALMTLIEDTRFSASLDSTPIEPEELPRTVAGDLRSRGDNEKDCGHIVAYHVTHEGVGRLPRAYPISHLYYQLLALLDWTHWEDNWGSQLVSSAPISHANTPNARTIFFSRTLFQSLASQGMTIPFAHLATLANVSMQLSITDQVDEETVRKQVRRYQAQRQSEAALRDDAE
jgi:hypothetical protein